MLKDKEGIFKKVYELAKDRHVKYNTNKKNKGIVSSINIDNPKELALTKEEKVLNDYLNSLDFEYVKIIQTRMYLGRDKDYDASSAPEEIYKEDREYMDNFGWSEKHI